MTLKEFCYDVLIEMRKEQEYKIDDVVDYVTYKAKEELDGKAGGIADDVIKSWVLEYDPNKKVEKEEEKPVKTKKISEMSLDEAIANAKAEHKPKKREVSGSWGTMESLF